MPQNLKIYLTILMNRKAENHRRPHFSPERGNERNLIFEYSLAYSSFIFYQNCIYLQLEEIKVLRKI